MSVKIESSVEEVKNWVSADNVYDVLAAFGIIEVDEFDNVGENQKISLTQNAIVKTTKAVGKIKLDFVFENRNEHANNLNLYLVEAA